MSAGVPDKRDVIKKTALRLFVERGFYGTPTSLISKEAGIATGTLFWYFPTKEELIDTLYREIKAEAGAAIRKDVDNEAPVRDKLRHVFLNSIGWGIKNPEKRQFMEQFAHSPFVSQRAHDEGMSNFSFLSGIVEEGIRAGEIKNTNTDLIFYFLAFSGSGVTDLVRKIRNPGEQQVLIGQALDLLWNGISLK
jgi:AcrR family transcriptional regulator